MPKNEIIERIFEYDNYRFFLKDYFQEQKRLKESFSHRSFAKKAGFASSSFFSHVVDGKRSLTESSLEKMTKGLALRGRRATFFQNLVQYNQADTIEKREKLYHKLNRIRHSSKAFEVNEEQWRYYENWYNPVIRELAPTPEWNGNFKKLGEQVVPIITPEKARESLDLLLEIGLLKEENGVYHQVQKIITAKEVPAVITRKMRRKFIHLAEEAMENLPIEERLISGVTVTLSENQYRQIEEKLNEIRQLILAEGIGESNDTGKVYQVNFQAYPLSDEVTLNNSGNEHV